jgi:septal ring factor EnvC (AmiA/AmiB activator)
LLNAYGDPRAGPEVRWRGVQIGAAPGTAVRAIYHGQVVYSDWFPGLGLLTIVDHGEGYMSLYGHNEALFKETGEWVTAGEAIGQVGDTGGQDRTALYFEILDDGEPVDPRRWLARAEPMPR